MKNHNDSSERMVHVKRLPSVDLDRPLMRNNDNRQSLISSNNSEGHNDSKKLDSIYQRI